MATVQIPSLNNYLRELYIVKQVDMMGFSILVYDYIITLGMEIELVWSTRWNVVKTLFIVQRYIPFLDNFALWMYQDYGGYHSVETCKILAYLSLAGSISGVVISEGQRVHSPGWEGGILMSAKNRTVLLTIRIWALWRPTMRLKPGLAIAFAMVWTPAVIACYHLLVSSEFADLSPLTKRNGCYRVKCNEVYAVLIFACLLIWDTLKVREYYYQDAANHGA
ncbi:hypothetical protein CPC08DRAFT_810078 [Agrocybe pediades]|nr:hypothetical protein CPC08DRAFT_810078 [Agrocybe pediades]